MEDEEKHAEKDHDPVISSKKGTTFPDDEVCFICFVVTLNLLIFG